MGLSVLLVDDCTQLLSVIGEYISSFGIHCFAVGTVVEARRILAHELVDVVVTDLLLERRPALSLIETASSLDLRVIVASALIEERIRHSLGHMADQVWVVEKPFDLSHLRRLITLGPRPSRCVPPAAPVVTPA